ncbi:MAG: sugar ABC transporter ATP-binding protein [Lachnospiraceae bacterium]|nr:sugar ABC transporter ATP-binding protein [Lachnospiraceae bacterium]
MIENKEDKLLCVNNVTKAFYGNTVLEHVSFEMNHGEVIGLVGQNGAGKSTMVKILMGAYQKDSGSILIEGKEADLGSIKAATQSGISMVFQELSLASNMTVADNIFINDLPTNAFNLIRKKELYEKTQKLIHEFNIDIFPDDKIGDLTIGKRQIVEIMKAISSNPKILILDEPTSSLEEAEIKVLFKFIEELKRKGYSIIYISHAMSEIFDIVDRIVVLRDGKKVEDCKKEELDVKKLINLMIGKEYESYVGLQGERKRSEEVLFSAKNLCRKPYFRDVDFEVRTGEILGFAGITGSGKTELCETLFGVGKLDAGTMEIGNKGIRAYSPSDCKEDGILLLPENRKTQGLFLDSTVRNNIIASIVKKVTTGIFLDNKKIDQKINAYQKALNIKMTSDAQIIRFLSGGNQQKVLFAKCIADEPKLLIAMDPTRGIDVAAKADIHKIMHELSEEGLSIIVISSELDELMMLCDRILVINAGKIITEYSRQDFDEEEILVSMHHHARD